MAVFDLYDKLNTDPGFSKKIGQLVDRLQAVEKHRAEINYGVRKMEAVRDLLRECNYNPSLLVPYMYPKYPKNKPLSLSSRPFAMSMLNLIVNGTITINASRQVGKSTCLILRQRLFTGIPILPRFKTLYVAPHASFQDIYSSRMKEMDTAYRFSASNVGGNPAFRDNLNLKEMGTGGRIRLIKCHTDSFAARSDTADELLFDECQLMDPDLVPDIQQCTQASDFPMEVRAGTATNTDSMLFNSYQNSSQGRWIIRCPDNKHQIDCGDPDDVIRCIKPAGLMCPYTGQPLNVRDGRFVHRYPERLEMGSIHMGLHVPQVIVPYNVEDSIQWQKLFTNFKNYPRHKFLEECLGIASQEGQREITLADLMDVSVLPWNAKERRKRGMSGKYRYVISGMDWGGTPQQKEHGLKRSYTVHCIIGVTRTGEVDILHFRRFSGSDFRTIINDIVQDHVAHGGTHMASDFGVGDAYHLLLREHPLVNPETHFIFTYTSPHSQALAQPANQSWVNQFSLNKSEALTQLFHGVKDKRIKCFNWEEAKDFMMEFMNVHRALAELPGGQTLWKFLRNPAKSDDAVQALNFAYTMARLLMGEPIISDPALLQRLTNMLNNSYSIHSVNSSINPADLVTSG